MNHLILGANDDFWNIKVFLPRLWIFYELICEKQKWEANEKNAPFSLKCPNVIVFAYVQKQKTLILKVLEVSFDFFWIFLERARRDTSIPGLYFFQEVKLDFIWIFEILVFLKMSLPVGVTLMSA